MTFDMPETFLNRSPMKQTMKEISHNLVFIYFFVILVIYFRVFLFCFFEIESYMAQDELKVLRCWSWPWTPDSSGSTFQVLVLHVYTTLINS